MSHNPLDIKPVNPYHNPNEGRIIINDNFQVLCSGLTALELISATGSTSVSPGTNVSVSMAIMSGVPDYMVSVIDNPVFSSVSATTISASTLYQGSTSINDLIGSSLFTSDITVSLSGGKTLGRYTNGQTIPSSGKTAQQVFNLIAAEPLSPTVSLTSPTTIQFNQTAISNILNFSYVINSLGASVSSVLLEARRNGAGSWSALTTNTGLTTYTQTLTDAAFNANGLFNYRYTVIDTAGASTIATLNITPASYVAPSITFSAPATSISSPESNTIREKGNISSVPQGSVTRNSSLVDVSSYQLYYSLNGGANVAIGTPSGLTAAGGTITSFTHNNGLLSGANTVTYYVYVTDAYTSATNASYLITFKNIIFYSPVASAPVNSANVRAMTNKIFTDGTNPFILNTGTVEKIFSVAMPATLSVSNITDLDALSANITASYILSTFNVNDAIGTPVSYHVYTMTNAVPYSDIITGHRHQITR